MGKTDKNQRSEVRSQKSENGGKVSESISGKDQKIDVIVIQAYREEVERPDGWGYVRHNVGYKMTIDAGEFCANVHKKVNSE